MENDNPVLVEIMIHKMIIVYKCINLSFALSRGKKR